MQCPKWEYTKHPQYADVGARSVALLIELRTGKINFQAAAEDTRPYHDHLYQTVIPKGFAYYAGHYRGEDFPCLKHREVEINGRRGSPPRKVRGELGSLMTVIRDGFKAADELFAPGSKHPREEQVYRLVRFACKIFSEFGKIHPYLNGNGHMQRWLVWVICGKYDVWSVNWPLHERPSDPPLTQLIRSYRVGNKDGLEKFILERLLGRA